MNKSIIIRVTIVLVFVSFSLFFSGCVPVKSYQKVHLNDEEMALENRKIEIYESNFQSYREGAVGGNNGNSGSGCGCN